MSTVYFNVGESEEQAIGPVLDSGRMQVYAVRRDRPTELIYLGGHPINDAPSYNTTEGKINPVYKTIQGRHIVVEEQMNSDYIKSLTLNLMLPNRLLSVTERIFQTQNSCTYDLLFVPNECFDGCDEFFWLLQDVKLSPTQFQNAIVGWDDNEGPINRMRTVRGTGNFVQYLGLEYDVVSSGSANEWYAVDVFEREASGATCAGCECPDQVLLRAGVDDTAVPTTLVIEKSEDGGASWSTFSNTTAALNIPMNIFVDGARILLPTTDDPTGASGSAGGILYIDGLSGTVEDATLGAATTGLHVIVKRGNILYAFGNEAFRSLDGGLNWEAVSLPVGFTEAILSAAIDKTTGNIFLGATSGNVLVFNGSSFVDITADITSTADVTAVNIPAPGSVQLGFADGTIEEVVSYEGLGSTWTSETLNADYTISGIFADGFNYRTIAVAYDSGVGSKIFVRDAFRKQSWEEVQTVGTTEFVNGDPGAILQEEGANAFFFAATDGTIAKFTACQRCTVVA